MTQTGDKVYGTRRGMDAVDQPRAFDPALLGHGAGAARNRTEGQPHPGSADAERDGLNTSEANAKYFGETLPALAGERMGGADRERSLTELRDACNDATTAYQDFKKFLATTFFESPTSTKVKAAFADDRYAMGEEEYNWAIKNNFKIEKTAAQLFDEAWPIVQATQTQMIDLAKKIGGAT